MAIALRARPSQLRCPLCRAALAGRDARPCARCRTRAHDACVVELRLDRCPAAGCGAPLAPPRVATPPRRARIEWSWTDLIDVALVAALIAVGASAS